jgi:DNA-binding transcriptional regulator YiaG
VRIPNLDGDGIAETLTAQVPVTIDPHTGEELMTEQALEIIENTKARHMGLLLAPELKKLRERLGLTQKRISELVQSGEKSWTRWETGKARPSRMVNVLLRLIYEGKVFVSDLVAQRKPGVDWRKNFHPQFTAMNELTPQTWTVAQGQQWPVCPVGTGLPPPASACLSLRLELCHPSF